MLVLIPIALATAYGMLFADMVMEHNRQEEERIAQYIKKQD